MHLSFLVLTMLTGISATICPPRPNADQQMALYAEKEQFFVDSDNGNDVWTGTLMRPNPNGDNGPFRTLDGAVKRIRKKRISKTKPVTLFVRSGIHFVERRIILDKRDVNLHFVGFPRDPERPVISGGRKIPGSHFVVHSQEESYTVYVAPFDGRCSAHVFLGNKRLLRARKPNIDAWSGADVTATGPYLRMRQLLNPTPDCNMNGDGGFKQRKCPIDNQMGFGFFPGDINGNWTGLNRVEILLFNAWTAERGKVLTVHGQDIVHFQQPLRFPIGKHPRPSGFRYVIENVFEELDAVGEFYCDPDRQLLFVIPPAGALATNDVFVSQTDNFFQVHRTQGISFSDIAFSHTHDKNFAGYNAKPAAIQVDYCEKISINRCRFVNIGYTAIFVKHSIDVLIAGSTFQDIGYQGVSVDYNTTPNDPFATRNIFIQRNTFVGCGITNLFQPSCIHVRGVRNIHVTDNDVSHTPYAGIRIGWQKVFARDHIAPGEHVFYIQRNNVHDYGKKILNDFGGIYLSSNMKDCGEKQNMSICHIHALISDNAIHHSEAYYYGALGVYGDTAVSSLTVRDNWIYRLSDTAINFHCGQYNVAVNNMIYHTTHKRVFGTCNNAVGKGGIPRQLKKPFHSVDDMVKDAPTICYAGPVETFWSFLYNVIYVDYPSPKMYGRNDLWEFDVPEVNFNNYYFPSTNPENLATFFPKGKSFSQWKNDTSNDRDSIIANPQFKNLESDVYTLQPSSPARGIGIGSVDLRSVIDNSGACAALEPNMQSLRSIPK